jgi:hypothetical protein
MPGWAGTGSAWNPLSWDHDSELEKTVQGCVYTADGMIMQRCQRSVYLMVEQERLSLLAMRTLQVVKGVAVARDVSGLYQAMCMVGGTVWGYRGPPDAPQGVWILSRGRDSRVEEMVHGGGRSAVKIRTSWPGLWERGSGVNGAMHRQCLSLGKAYRVGPCCQAGGCEIAGAFPMLRGGCFLGEDFTWPLSLRGSYSVGGGLIRNGDNNLASTRLDIPCGARCEIG